MEAKRSAVGAVGHDEVQKDAGGLIVGSETNSGSLLLTLLLVLPKLSVISFRRFI
jgi:hypothetical protein